MDMWIGPFFNQSRYNITVLTELEESGPRQKSFVNIFGVLHLSACFTIYTSAILLASPSTPSPLLLLHYLHLPSASSLFLFSLYLQLSGFDFLTSSSLHRTDTFVLKLPPYSNLSRPLPICPLSPPSTTMHSYCDRAHKVCSSLSAFLTKVL